MKSRSLNSGSSCTTHTHTHSLQARIVGDKYSFISVLSTVRDLTALSQTLDVRVLRAPGGLNFNEAAETRNWTEKKKKKNSLHESLGEIIEMFLSTALKGTM